MKNDFPRLAVSPEIQRKMLELAREFRKELTPSEDILWQALRGKKLDGTKFRRQQPVGYFVVDFIIRFTVLSLKLMDLSTNLNMRLTLPGNRYWKNWD